MKPDIKKLFEPHKISETGENSMILTCHQGCIETALAWFIRVLFPIINLLIAIVETICIVNGLLMNELIIAVGVHLALILFSYYLLYNFPPVRVTFENKKLVLKKKKFISGTRTIEIDWEQLQKIRSSVFSVKGVLKVEVHVITKDGRRILIFRTIVKNHNEGNLIRDYFAGKLKLQVS